MRKIKDILRLRKEAGLSYRAIAQALNIGYGTVVGYLERADKAGLLQWPLPPDTASPRKRQKHPHSRGEDVIDG